MDQEQEDVNSNLGSTDGIIASRPSPDKDPETQRIRKILLVIMRIFLGFAIFGLFSTIFEFISGNNRVYSEIGPKIVQTIATICLYAFGISAANRYSPTKLRVFAWLNIVVLVLSTIGFAGIVTVIILGIDLDKSIQKPTIGGNEAALLSSNILLVVIIIMAVIFLLVSVISIFLIRLSFKLARRLDDHKSWINEQI